MNSFFVVGGDGQTYGPVDQPTLFAWAQAGRVGPSSQVNVVGTPNYIQAAHLPFLAAAFPQMVPPMPAPQGAMAVPAPAHGLGYAQPNMAPMSNTFNTFSTPGAILLHFVTLGIFTHVWLNLYHGKMPVIRNNDPSAGKAIGFLFIPFFNLYWVFFTYLRLCDRINEQRRAHGLADCALRGLALTMCILMVIPYIGLISAVFLAPIFLGIVQSGINELVLAQHGQRRSA